MDALQNTLYFVILLGALVTFHELGHFLIAKACGVRVLRFSVGFGPELLGLTKGHTRYSLCAIPLGGYVKMHGDTPDAEVPPDERGQAFNYKPLWQRSLIVLGGPVFNFILAYLIYFGLSLGEREVLSTTLSYVVPDQPAARAGLREGDVIVEVDSRPVRRWEELRDAIADRAGETVAIAYERAGERSTVKITVDSVRETNLYGEQASQGRIGIGVYHLRPIVAVVDPSSPAALAGVAQGDEVVAVAQFNRRTDVSTWYELRRALSRVAVGQPVTLMIKRGEQEVPVQLTAAAQIPAALSWLDADRATEANWPEAYYGLVAADTVVQTVEPDSPASRAGLRVGDRIVRVRTESPGDFEQKNVDMWAMDLNFGAKSLPTGARYVLTVQRGVDVLELPFIPAMPVGSKGAKAVATDGTFGAAGLPGTIAAHTHHETLGIVGAVAQAGVVTVETMNHIITGFLKLFGGKVPMDTLGGPVMLFGLASKSAQSGVEAFLGMMAVISINLGIFNLLPVPVLDGGHLVFFGLEAIARRPLPLKIREMAYTVGFFLLMLLMVVALRNDLLRSFG